MILFKATFTKKAQALSDDLEVCLEEYFSALIKNGQIYGGYDSGWHGDQMVVVTHLPSARAVSPRNNSGYAAEALTQLRKLLAAKPEWQPLTSEGDITRSSLKRAPFLYLQTDAFTIEPPIQSGHDGQNIPTYMLPLDPLKREEIYFWSRSYAVHDRMWIQSGDLETAAYRQLSRLDSSLASEGREICAMVEAATNIPTYYYLMRYYRQKSREAQRLCPGCGRNWQANSVIENQPFWEFHFKCDPCRLVSHCGVE